MAPIMARPRAAPAKPMLAAISGPRPVFALGVWVGGRSSVVVPEVTPGDERDVNVSEIDEL